MGKYLPHRLYKYQPYNKRTLDNLRRHIIWFSKPARFNDPFDLALLHRLEQLTDEQWQHLVDLENSRRKERREQYLRVSRATTVSRHFNDDVQPDEEFKHRYLRMARWITEDLRDLHRKTYAVACFSRIVDDILMWAHYADGHRGFCLEFDTSFPPFVYAKSVKYSQEIPAWNLFVRPVGYAGVGKPLPRLDIVKSKHWRYEKEWRIVGSTKYQAVEIDPAALTAIYFGCAMPARHQELISSLLASASTMLYQMKRSETEFKVEPCPYRQEGTKDI